MYSYFRCLDRPYTRGFKGSFEAKADVCLCISSPRRPFFTRDFKLEKPVSHTPFTIILSKDILEHHCADATDADIWLEKGMHWSDRLLSVYATGSNDSGVSWIVETAGKRIFHAGDLNNWYARFLNETYQNKDILTEEFEYVNPQQEENRFLEELNDIEKITKQFDVVMFPVDGRIGNGYTKGARQFLDHFDVGTLIPMHFAGSSFESAWRMNEFAQEKGVDFWCIKHEGETKEIF